MEIRYLGLRFAVACSAATFLGMLGCGSGTVSSLTAPTGPVSAEISPVGGSLSSGSSTLVVPAGAVSASAQFTIGPATSYPANTELLAGSAYAVSYANTFLLQPMTLSIQYSTLPAGAVTTSLTMYTAINSTTWNPVANSSVNTSSSTVTASIQAPGTYAIFVTQSTAVNTTTPGTILLNRGAHTGANAMAAMNTDASGYSPLLTSAANSYVSTAHFSPSGSTIAYDYTDGVHGFYIYTMNSTGSGITTLTGGALKPDSTYSNNTNPSFNAAGSTIAYISDLTGTPQIYTMTSTGGSITQLTNMVDTAISNVFFTQSGNIAFYATVSGIGSWYQVSPTGTGLAPVNNSPINIAYVTPWNAFSPSGTTIATGYLQGNSYDLYAFSTNGSVRTRLTNLSASAIIAPHYTSDGTKIVFEAVVNGSGSIYIVNANGTNLVNLTQSNGPDALLDLH